MRLTSDWELITMVLTAKEPWQGASEEGLNGCLAIMASYYPISRLDGEGMTSLGCPSQFGRVETIHFLIEFLHIDMNGLSDDGRIVLHIAAQFPQSAAFNALFNRGGNPLISHPQWSIAVHQGLTYRNADFLDTLCSQLCFTVVCMDNFPLVQLVPNSNADPFIELFMVTCDGESFSGTDRTGNSLLTLAVRAGNQRTVQTPLEIGADILYRTQTECNVFHDCVESGNTTCTGTIFVLAYSKYSSSEMNELLTAGDESGNTPLHFNARKKNVAFVCYFPGIWMSNEVFSEFQIPVAI
jgi:ankyrin repeat protein